MDIVTVIALGLLGLCAGSFTGATVWRLRARQLVQDKKAKEPYDKKEYARLTPLTKTRLLEDRSRCLHCGYTLRWYDLIPLVSWISLAGTCRSCKHPIGWFEPLIEAGLALFFVISFVVWPHPLVDVVSIGHFALWLTAGTLLALLFAYDAKWSLLPNRVNFALMGVGVLFAGIGVAQSSDVVSSLVSIAGALAALSGLYFVLYHASRGRWVGFGDVKLGVGLALLVADWRLALLALFLANLLGSLWVLPFMIARKLDRQAHVPFGPFLILGAVIAVLWGGWIIDGYLWLIGV